MKKMFVFCVALFASTNLFADKVSVTISDGIDNTTIKSKMETSISKILTEINNAQSENRNLNFSVMGINTDVQKSLAMLWENTPFMCTDKKIVEHGLTTPKGYQVRNIPLMMKPTGERAFNEEEYQEAVISFNLRGDVESFYLTISRNLYAKILKENKSVNDYRHRQLVLDFTEQFRTAYNQKDIAFIEKVFSDDALIITGKVITQKHAEGFTTQKVKYYAQKKHEYIPKLRSLFRNAKYIKVSFDDIKVLNTNNPNVYGVRLRQGWTSKTSTTYHDDGFLFLLWDFSDEDHPQIHVRTWQPYELNGKVLPEEDLFVPSDFNI